MASSNVTQAFAQLRGGGHGYHSFQDGLQSLQLTVEMLFSKDPRYTLFRWKDWPAWVTFTCIFAALITFDNAVLHRKPHALTVKRAVFYTLFWISTAVCFCGWVYWYYGESQAFMWMSGYMLEWMLSFDNLFVFHLIFSVYGTPDNMKHRPLYLGIIGAVFFRLGFIFVGEYLMHALFFMHFLFGGFLVYTGVKTVTADDDDEDPSRQPLVMWLQKKLPFVSCYDDRASFFVRVPVTESGEAVLPEGAVANFDQEAEPLEAKDGEEKASYGSVDFGAEAQRSAGNTRSRTQWRATMLFLVVVCLEISDLIFAVDSVSAIVAQVSDLFLAYTSAVFAMLGLRATFFIIDVLVKLFSLLKYGVAAVLVFIGIKLIVGHYYRIPPSIVCVVLVSAIALSMAASVMQEELTNKAQGKTPAEVDERVAKVKSPPAEASTLRPRGQADNEGAYY